MNPIVLLSVFLLFSQIIAPSSTFNISTISFSSTPIDTTPPPPSPSRILNGVLKAVSEKQRWRLEDIRVSRVRNSRIGYSQKQEFSIPVGKKKALLVRFSEKVSSWRKLGRKDGFRNRIRSAGVLGSLRLEGPFELRVGGADELRLMLSPLNITHSSIKRLIVGEGITVIVDGAQEISLFPPSDFGLPINRSMQINGNRNQYWPSWNSLCMQLPPIHVLGSASLLAFKTHNPDAHIRTSFLSWDMVELLPDKCYSGPSYKRQICPVKALTKRLDLLKNVLRSMAGEKFLQHRISGSLKAKITMSTLVRFELELERDVRDDDAFWGTLAEWRTKPTSEKVNFEVVARVEGVTLMPLMVKRVRTFIAAESTAWSTLMSNISFTKFASAIGPPEALTLDVKW